jgi:hypothetical protein
MTANPTRAPGHVNNLTSRLQGLATAQVRPVRRLQRAVANTIVGQMLPPGVVKGGTGMKLRVGEAASRFTPDFDAARAAGLSIDDYIEQFAERLAAGWHGFTGTIAPHEQRKPEGVPPEYIMEAFDIRLSYENRAWLTVLFELGRDEVGSTATFDLKMPDDIRNLFAALGLPQPEPIAVQSVHHQIAQKLHACTWIYKGGNERAHDLVDLQILDQEEAIDLGLTAETARRLFESRHAQTWPPSVRAYDEWPAIYSEAADGLGVLTDLNEAIAWANSFIARIDGAALVHLSPGSRTRRQ